MNWTLPKDFSSTQHIITVMCLCVWQNLPALLYSSHKSAHNWWRTEANHPRTGWQPQPWKEWSKYITICTKCV